MSEIKVCQSYIPGSLLCADGFPIKPLCQGAAGCTMCGHIPDSAIPLCMTEEAPPHLFNDAGMPRHALQGRSSNQ